MQSASPDCAQLKSNMRASWMAGDFGQIANFTVKAAEDFVARTQISFGTRVLDVASVQVTLPSRPHGQVVWSQEWTSHPICCSKPVNGRQKNNWKYGLRRVMQKTFRSAIMNSMSY
jgi:hypothetical protein